MKSVKIAELKNRLSHYLRLVQRASRSSCATGTG